MFKNVSLILGSMILSTSIALAGPGGAKELPKSEGKASEGKSEGKSVKEKTELLNRVGGGKKAANDNNTVQSRDASTENRTVTVQSRSQLQVSADAAKEAGVGKAEVVNKGEVKAVNDNAVVAKADKAVDVIDGIVSGSADLVAVQKLSGTLDGGVQQAVARGFGARVAEGTLVGEYALGVLETNANVQKYLGEGFLSRSIGAGKECAQIGKEAGASVEAQSEPIKNLSKIYEGVEKLPANDNAEAKLENVVRLGEANLAKLGLNDGLARQAALGGKDVNGEEGPACNILNARMALKARQLKLAAGQN